MFVQTYDKFNGGIYAPDVNPTRGGGTLPPDIIAIAIAPSSDVDMLSVAGRLLGIGAVLPVRGGEQLLPVRSFATGGIAGANIVQNLDLLCWRCNEQPFKPGPLAPRPVRVAGDKAGLPAGSYTRIARCVGQGRYLIGGTARVTGAGTTPQISIIVRGVNYVDRETALNSPSTEPCSIEGAAKVVAVAAAVTNGDPVGVTLTIPSDWDVDEYQIWANDTGTAWAGTYEINLTTSASINYAG